jgi:hypothetical protein
MSEYSKTTDEPEIEVTKEMIEAGEVLEHELWLLDASGKPLPMGALKLFVPDFFRAMAALAKRP